MESPLLPSRFGLLVVRLTIVVLTIATGLVIWTIFRGGSLWRAIKEVPVALPAASPLESAEPSVASSPISEDDGFGVWGRLLMKAPLDILGGSLGSVDARLIPVSELFAPPIRATLPPMPNPRRLREMMDRGVVGYASASSHLAQVRAAYRIQAAALAGYGPAGDMIAGLYPQSQAIRLAVPPADAIRYALDMLAANATVAPPETKRVLSAMMNYFANQGDLVTFSLHLVGALREDRRPQFSHRIDVILELLEGVPGACRALARAVAPTAQDSETCTASLNESLVQQIQSTGSRSREADKHRRAVQMFDQFGTTR